MDLSLLPIRRSCPSWSSRVWCAAMCACMGIGLSLIFGILGVVNFAHGEFFMLGTYVMYFVSAALGLPFLAGVAAAAIALFVVGVLVERALLEPLRRRAGRDWLLDSVRAHHRPHGDPAEHSRCSASAAVGAASPPWSKAAS